MHLVVHGHWTDCAAHLQEAEFSQAPRLKPVLLQTKAELAFRQGRWQQERDGAIILGNGVGACWLSREREWACVRPLAIVAVVYGTLVALALLYHLLWLHAPSLFWIYFLFDTPFLIVFYALFLYHDIIPLIQKKTS